MSGEANLVHSSNSSSGLGRAGRMASCFFSTTFKRRSFLCIVYIVCVYVYVKNLKKIINVFISDYYLYSTLTYLSSFSSCCCESSAIRVTEAELIFFKAFNSPSKKAVESTNISSTYKSGRSESLHMQYIHTQRSC